MKATTLRTETFLHIHKAKVFCFLFLIRSEFERPSNYSFLQEADKHSFLVQSNLSINPAALLPGATPTIKSTVDVDAPLESATKTRSRGQAGRRPPSRRARQKIAQQASEGECRLFPRQFNPTVL